MQPGPTYNIDIFQNATFKMSIQLTNSGSGSSPIDITGWSFSGSIKQNYEDSDPSLIYFSASVLDPTQSIVMFSLTPTQTAQLTQPIYYYDCIAVNYPVAPDEVYRILQGRVKVSPGVTDAHIIDF
jgi:hypothetical protein